MVEKCKVCGKDLTPAEDILCNKCFDREMALDIKDGKEHKEEIEESADRAADFASRFRDSSGRSTFERGRC